MQTSESRPVPRIVVRADELQNGEYKVVVMVCTGGGLMDFAHLAFETVGSVRDAVALGERYAEAKQLPKDTIELVIGESRSQQLPPHTRRQ